MARQITKDMAKTIARKLDAKPTRGHGTAHDVLGLWHNGIFVCKISIRHSSNRDIGHDHIPKELKVSPRFAKEIARCSRERDDWVRQMIEIGEIQPPPE